jgi:diacylglycerol kinase (ATP)
VGVRVALILNSRSGSVGDPDALIARIREATDSLSVHDPGEGAAAAAKHPDRIVVAGGDGSIGDAFAAAASARIPLAVIPAGTANDFARALALPEDRDEAIASPSTLMPRCSRRGVAGSMAARS